jgi:hypothetical protein
MGLNIQKKACVLNCMRYSYSQRVFPLFVDLSKRRQNATFVKNLFFNDLPHRNRLTQFGE